MTIAVSTTIRRRPWRGYDDPGLPVGMYVGQHTVAGDASGGDMIIFFDFKGEGEPVSGFFFNVEQINVFASVTTVTIAHAVATNWETIGDAGLVNRQWKLGMQNNLNDVSALDSDTYFPLPLFLGSVAPIASLAATLEFGTDNLGVAESFTATIQGYIWEPRSIQAEGGLRRPVDSLYGGGGHL